MALAGLLVLGALGAAQAAVTKVSPPGDGTIIGFSLDGARLIYAATNQLYSVRVDGSDAGAPLHLNALPLTQSVGNYSVQFTASGQVVFVAGTNSTDLFVNNVAGGDLQRLTTGQQYISQRGTEDGIALPAFIFSPDRTKIAFFGRNGTFRGHVYTVPVSGGPVTQVTPTFGATGDASSFQWAGNGTIVYRADANQDAMYELYSISAAGGGTPTKVNFNLGPAHAGGTGLNPNVKTIFVAGDDGARVVYMADPTHTVGVNSNFPFNLYSAPVGGGTSTQLNPVDTSVPSARYYATGGTNVIFYTDSTTNGKSAVCVAPMTPPPGWSGPVRLTDPTKSAGNVWSLTPDNGRAVYSQRTGGRYDLYAQPVGGGPATLLSNTNYPAYLTNQYSDITSVAFNGDGQSVYYVTPYSGAPSSDDETVLWKSSLTGDPAPTRLWGSLSSIGLRRSADGAWISCANDVFVLSAADDVTWQLRDPDGLVRRPEFGPDPTRMAFKGTEGGTNYLFYGSPVGALRITGVSPAGNDVGLTFDSLVGRFYAVDRNDDLTVTNGWSVFTNNVPGAAGPVPVTDAGALAAPKRFYRGRLLP